VPTCPNGHENPEGQPFCGQCGEAISKPKPAVDDAPIPEVAATEETQAPGDGAPKTSALPKWLTVRRNQFIAGGVAATVVLVVSLALALGSGGGGQQSSPPTTASPQPPLTTVPGARGPLGPRLVPRIPVNTWTNADTRAFIVNWDDNAANGTLDRVTATVSAGCASAVTRVRYPKVADYIAAVAANGNRYPPALIAAIDNAGCS
jgi:hypothetical protein